MRGYPQDVNLWEGFQLEVVTSLIYMMDGGSEKFWKIVPRGTTHTPIPEKNFFLYYG